MWSTFVVVSVPYSLHIDRSICWCVDTIEFVADAILIIIVVSLGPAFSAGPISIQFLHLSARGHGKGCNGYDTDSRKISLIHLCLFFVV